MEKKVFDEEKMLQKLSGVEYMRLQFMDIFGMPKNVEIPAQQFGKALKGEVMFDGSSIDGFTRIEESDMLLVPDKESLLIYPEDIEKIKTARMICDVHNADATPFL